MSDIATKIEQFFSKYAQKNYAKGEVIIRAEESPPGVLYIAEGRVSQYDISPAGGTVVVNVFKNPAFFPMSWAMNNTENHYFFEAATDVVIRQAPPSDVIDFLRKNPDVLYDLLARVYRGTDGMLRRMAHLMGGGAKNRLRFELLNAAYRFGEQHEDGIFVPLKESDLAQHSGLARETINRNIQELKAAGFVSVSQHGFVVKDMKRLEDELGNEV